MTRWQPDAEGRLQQAALELFGERGFESTTVAEIAERAGLTKRTFFRYFADKREVLFRGSEALTERFVSGVAGAPPQSTALEAIEAGLLATAEMFTERHEFARRRAWVVAANPELMERELIKLASLAESVADALRARGVPDPAAGLAAQTAITIFHIAFGRWVAQDDPGALAGLMRESLIQLQELTAEPPDGLGNRLRKPLSPASSGGA